MIEDQEKVPGERFDHDLALIRKARKVNLLDVHRETRVPTDVLDQFEQGQIQESALFNTVYLRAFLQGYAQAVGISTAKTLQALDDTLQGRYRGELAVEYLGIEPPPAPEPVELLEAEEAEQPHSPAESPAERLLSLPGRKPMAGKLVIGAATAAIFVILMVVLVVPQLTSEQVTVQSGNTDQGEGAIQAETAPLVPPEPQELGDSLRMVIVAVHDKLEPIRVRADTDLLRPYWIDQGDSLTFAASDRFAIRGALTRAEVLVEGHRWPRLTLNTSGELVIHRDAVRDYLDSLYEEQHRAYTDSLSSSISNLPEAEQRANV